MADKAPAEDQAPRSGMLLIVKLILGFAVLACLWGFVLRGTRLDPVAQVGAAVNHFINPEGPVDLDGLAKQITSQDDKKRYKKAIKKLREGSYYGAARDLTQLGAKYSTLNYPLGRHYLNLGAKLLKENKFRQANECLRISVDYFVRQSGRAHHLLAQTFERLGQPKEAKRHLELAKAYETNSPNAPFDPGGLLLSLGLTLVASLVLGALLTAILGPAKTTAVPQLAPQGGDMPSFWNTPDTTGGEISDEEKKYGSITKVLTAEQRLDQVTILFEEGMYEDAFEVFRKAAALNPGVSKKISKMCLDQGIKLYETEDLTRAAELFEVALQHDPHSLHGHTYLANCCIKMDLFDKAVEHYLSVVRINPDNATGYYNLGICYHKIGDVQNALRAFDVAVEKEDLPNAHFYLAKLNEGLGDKGKAIKHWKRCKDLAPNTPQGKRATERLKAITGH